MEKLKTIKLPVKDQEWRDFSALCRKNGTTMTKVFVQAIKEYMKGGKVKWTQ